MVDMPIVLQKENSRSMEFLYDKLAINNGPNSLHGGVKGFNFYVWDANQLDKQTIEFSRLSPDGEEGFPGNLQVKVIFKLTDDNAVDITYYAETDKPTIVNLTNHSYFNLSVREILTSVIICYALMPITIYLPMIRLYLTERSRR